MGSRSRKLLKALQVPNLVINETQFPPTNNIHIFDYKYTTLTPVPPSNFDLNNTVYNEIMEKKSGPDLFDNHSTSNESRNTTEWLLQKI